MDHNTDEQCSADEMHQKKVIGSKGLKQWKCNLIFNETSSDTDEPRTVDLCEFLLSPLVPDSKYPVGSNYMFPEHFKGEQSKTKLVTELKQAATRCGYILIITSSRKTSQGGIKIRLGCKHSVIFQPQKNEADKDAERSKRKRKVKGTERATDLQDVCPFAFVIFMQAPNSSLHPERWFLAYRKGMDAILQYKLHKNHSKIDPHLDKEKKLKPHCGGQKLCKLSLGMDKEFSVRNHCRKRQSHPPSSDEDHDLQFCDTHTNFAANLVNDDDDKHEKGAAVNKLQATKNVNGKHFQSTGESSYQEFQSWVNKIHKLVENNSVATRKVCAQMKDIYINLLKETKSNKETVSSKQPDDTGADYSLPFLVTQKECRNKQGRSTFEK